MWRLVPLSAKAIAHEISASAFALQSLCELADLEPYPTLACAFPQRADKPRHIFALSLVQLHLASSSVYIRTAMALIDKVPGELKLYIGGYVMDANQNVLFRSTPHAPHESDCSNVG